MSTRLVYNFRYDAAIGYVADSVDTKLCYEKLYLDYRPACYVLVEACGTQRSNFLTPHVLKFVSLIQDVLLLRQTQNQQAEDVASYTCYVTDIVLRGERANFIQCIVNDLGLDITPDFMGQLVIVEFTSHAAYKLCYQTLKNNSAAPWYRSLPDICEIGVALQLYKCAFGTPMASKGTPPHVECLGFKVTDRIDLLERFLPLGFYHTFNGTGVYTKLNLLTHKPPSLERILPMVSIDIETVARSPHVVPMGTTHDEKISSLSMYLLYGQIHVHVCLYLNPTPARTIATASETAAAQFEKKMNSKYNNHNNNNKNNQPEGEGDRPRRLFALFKGYDSEKAMLEAFCEYYSQGGIFLLVDLPRRYPHILTGHNLIAYDLRVIWRRMIFLKIEQLLHSVHRIKHEHDELHHPEFNDLAIVLDLMVLAKKNMLSDKLSLAAIAANRLRSEHVTKMDLDSSIIRRVYAYAVAATRSSEASADFNKVYRVSSAPPTYSSHDDNFDFTDTRVELVRLKRALYKDTRLCDVPELMPRLEQVLVYNIQDTITVTRVLLDSNILALVTELTSLFCLNAEESGMCGNSRRLAACLVHNGLKHGTFIANRCDRAGIGPLDTYHSFSGGGGGGGGGGDDFEDVDNDHRESGADAATAAASRRVAVSRRRTARIGGLATDRTKNAYQGALNYARDQEFFNAVESFDFKSYYPNLSCYLNADSTNCSVITVEFIQSLSPPIVAILERCVRADLVRLFAMQDPCVPTEELLTPGYRGREIGHCLCWEDVCALDSREPVLAMFEMDTRERFIGRVLDGLLKQRRQLQEALRAATSLTERRILDSQQLGTKIILNSVYGVTGCSSFLYSHIPASAAVTLFGRKFLTICARLICTFYALASTEGASSSSSSGSDGGGGGDVRAWYEAELRYLTTWAVNRSSQKAGERAVIAAGRGRSGGDGVGDLERMSAAERKQRIPFADLVCYVDTDGLKFYNPNNVDAAAILKRVNEAMSFTKYLTLAIEKRHDHVMILTKKKYAYCDVENGMNVGHVGYERHANTIVKKILTGVVRVCCERAATNPLYVLFDIFGCLHATNPCLLFERIKLNHHENESSLQRYIDSVSKDYKGDIKTVLLLDDGGDVTRDLYEPQVVWSAHQRPLNLAKFIRKFHKIIKRLLMSAQSRHEIWSKTQMESPLLIYAAYHAWLDNNPNRQNDKVLGKIVPLVEFIRPHLHNYQMIAKQTLPLEDAIDSHNVRLKKRSSGHVRVIRKLI